MSIVKIKIQPWFKKLSYLVLACSWITGLTFYIMNNWITVAGEFGPEKHPWQFNVLMLHGASAFIMLMVFGAILTNHIPLTWHTKRLRKIGITLASFIVMQAITAYLLYYLANEEIRNITSYIHLIMGLSLPVVLIIHIILGKRRE